MPPPMSTTPMGMVGMVWMPLHLRAVVGRSVRLAQIGRDRHCLRRSGDANGDHTDGSGGNRFLGET
jgi:hypothetical protein